MSDTVISPTGQVLHLVATMQTTPQTDTSIKEIRIKMNPAPGLPILLARYCIVPKNIPNALPAWAGGKLIKDVNIGSDYHYALRTLRAGFVYIFYDKNPTGSNQWECYTVNTDGSVVKQPSAAAAQAPADKIQGNTLDTHAIEIEHPDQCGTAWIESLVMLPLCCAALLSGCDSPPDCDSLETKKTLGGLALLADVKAATDPVAMMARKLNSEPSPSLNFSGQKEVGFDQGLRKRGCSSKLSLGPL